MTARRRRPRRPVRLLTTRGWIAVRVCHHCGALHLAADELTHALLHAAERGDRR